jgi:hypothetical protein
MLDDSDKNDGFLGRAMHKPPRPIRHLRIGSDAMAENSRAFLFM